MIPITKNLINPCSEMMTHAFFNYPTIRYMFPNEKTRQRRSFHFFKALVNYGRLVGKAYVSSPKIESLIIWLDETQARFPFVSVMRSGIPYRFARAGFRFLWRFQKYNQFQNTLIHKHINFPHNYVMFLAVDPAYQGKSYSTEVMQFYVQETKTDNLPTYYETYFAKNVEIYKHMQGEVLFHDQMPQAGIEIWGMKLDLANLL